jgi:hypothetical protein
VKRPLLLGAAGIVAASAIVGCSALLDFDRLRNGHDQGIATNDDLAGADLTGADLIGFDLTDVQPDLIGADLTGIPSGCTPAVGGPFFDPADERTVPSTPRSFVIADIDGDRKLDLVYGTDANMVYVQKNVGGRAFGPAIGYASGCTLGYNHTTLVGDFDGDGKKDIVSGCDDFYNNNMVNEFAFLKGDGNGAFAAPVQFSNRPGNPLFGITADLDGDGLSDAIVIDKTANGIAIYWGAASGLTTQTPLHIATSYAPWTVAAAPMGGDSILDLVIANGGGDIGDMAVAHGKIDIARRSRSSARMLSIAGGDAIDVGTSEPVGCAMGNLNGDTRPDLVALYIGTDLYGALGAGGTPVTLPTPGIIANTYPSQNDVAVGDLDCDGRDDVVVTHFQLISDPTEYDRFEVFHNMNGTLVKTLDHNVAMTGAPSSDRVHIADLDGDGHPDIAMTVLGASSAGDRIRLLWGRATAP